MSFDQALNFVPTFVLVLFRVGGMMAFAPLFGSSRIPKRVRGLLSIVLTLGLMQGVNPPINLPQTSWQLAMGIGGEIIFGAAMGMCLSMVFYAVQWAGEVMGQQMGFNLAEVFDPSFGSGGSVVGEMYFMLTLVIFLLVRGHHAMLIGVHESFSVLPLMSVGMTTTVFDTVVGLLQACTILAMQLAAPMLVTMLIVELALGFIGKTVPQFNVMTAGLTLRSIVGMFVLIVGLTLSSNILRGAVLDSMEQVRVSWTSQ